MVSDIIVDVQDAASCLELVVFDLDNLPTLFHLEEVEPVISNLYDHMKLSKSLIIFFYSFIWLILNVESIRLFCTFLALFDCNKADSVLECLDVCPLAIEHIEHWNVIPVRNQEVRHEVDELLVQIEVWWNPVVQYSVEISRSFHRLAHGHAEPGEFELEVLEQFILLYVCFLSGIDSNLDEEVVLAGFYINDRLIFVVVVFDEHEIFIEVDSAVLSDGHKLVRQLSLFVSEYFGAWFDDWWDVPIVDCVHEKAELYQFQEGSFHFGLLLFLVFKFNAKEA